MEQATNDSQLPTESIQPPAQQPPAKKKINIKAIAVISLAVGLSLTAFGFIVFLLLNSLRNTISPVQLPAPQAIKEAENRLESASQVITTSSSPSRFSSWQVYRNEKLGYSFEYPVELPPQSIAPDNSFDNVVLSGFRPDYAKGYNVFIQAQTTKRIFASIEDYLKDPNSGQKPSGNLNDYTKIQVAGITAYRYVLSSDQGLGDVAIYFLRNNRLFKVGYTVAEPILHYDAQEVLDRIVATLQFY